MNSKVNILDCTLRDGGYVNDWNFGRENISLIVSKLHEAEVEYVECGYLSGKDTCSIDRTIFTSLDQINSIVGDRQDAHYTCMINYGSFDFTLLPEYVGKGIDTIRVAFHKNDMVSAIRDSSIIKDKGYNVFLQPMATSTYSEEELKHMLSMTNSLKPLAVYIVDSFGTMQSGDVLGLYELYSRLLLPNIIIGFHSHNNLQLSFPNSQEILKHIDDRPIIIDSSVFGMGRGAGNLCTELIIRYLNQYFGKSYNLVPILEIIDSCLNQIFIRTPWGYSVPYYIASANGCHPNYATSLVNKQTLGVSQINTILSRIPVSRRNMFDCDLIEKLYSEFQNYSINDSADRRKLSESLSSRSILILAPGKSLNTHFKEIQKYIETNSPAIISLNFIPGLFKVDYLFLSNLKRFDSIMSVPDVPVISTSNIPEHDDYFRIDYSSLINSGEPESDNAGLMLLRFLDDLCIHSVAIAGFDGFSEDIHENYCDEKLINNTVTEIFAARNYNIKTQLAEIRKTMNVDLITPSRYA